MKAQLNKNEKIRWISRYWCMKTMKICSNNKYVFMKIKFMSWKRTQNNKSNELMRIFNSWKSKLKKCSNNNRENIRKSRKNWNKNVIK